MTVKCRMTGSHAIILPTIDCQWYSNTNAKWYVADMRYRFFITTCIATKEMSWSNEYTKIYPIARFKSSGWK